MESNLAELAVSALKKKCGERGLAKTGIKADLVRRIQEHDEKSRPQPPATTEQPLRRSDCYRPQYDNVRHGFGDLERGRDQRSPSGDVRQGVRYLERDRDQRSSENVRREVSNAGHLRLSLATPSPQQLIEAFRDSPGDITAARLTEDQLERICRQHYMPWKADPKGDERKTVIATEYATKAEELTKKRDAAILRAHRTYKNEMDKLLKDRDDKIKEVDKDVAPWKENYNWWKPAFNQLTRLKASQGLVTNPRDYGPRNPGSSSYMASSPPTRLNLNSNTFSLTSTPTTPTSSISSSLKRQASKTAMASSSTIPPALRARDLDDPYLDAPIGPRADTLVEREPIGPKLANDPHIFILGGEIRVSGENIHHMQAILSSARFSPTVRADRTGFFLIFRHSAEGEREAAVCFDRFNGRQFTGIPMEMELRRRDGSRISSN